MGLDFKVKFCHREDNGLLTLRIQVLVDGVPWLKSFEVVGENSAELESKLRPKMAAIKDRYDDMVVLSGVAQQKIDALKTELGIN